MAHKSYLHVPLIEPFDFSNVPDLLDQRAEQTPSKEAYVFHGKTENPEETTRTVVKYKQLADRSVHVASILLTLGLRPGDRIAVIGQPSSQWLYVDYAAMRIKVLLVRIPTTLTRSDQLRAFLEKHKCRMLFLDSNLEQTVLASVVCQTVDSRDNPNVTVLDNNKDVFPEMVVFTSPRPDYGTFMTLENMCEIHGHVDEERVMAVQRTIDADDPAWVFPTTGTTGTPKLVVMSYIGYIRLTRDFASYYKLGEIGDDTCFFNNRPYTWGASFEYVPAILGWKLVSTDTALAADREAFSLVFRIIREEVVQCVFLPVFMIMSAIQQQKSFPTSVQHIITGGEKITNKMLSEALQYVKSVFVMYGCTEASGATTCGQLEDTKCINSASNVEAAARYRPFPGSELKIVSPENQIMPRGEPGTNLLRSKACFVQYLDDELATRVIRDQDGWVNTHDAGIIHPSGFLQVIGRTSDLISKGSCKIYPITVEHMLIKCEQVAKVVVFGVPDKIYGQEIAACVVAKPNIKLTEDALRGFCEKNGTNVYGISLYPKYFLVTEEFPLNAHGKIDCAKLAQILGNTITNLKFRE